ncbi:MAG: acetyl-CoA carboxylase carboxyl transferase subunit beta, partial [Lachnospiraceae bacterium]|nr:acetyl-CoA carboxylase carboxyl transferase subunit beta [Lachnospiraceae bacterium]
MSILLKNTKGSSQRHRAAEESVSDNEFVKCPKCGRYLDKRKVITHKYVCYECGAYFRVRTNNR